MRLLPTITFLLLCASLPCAPAFEARAQAAPQLTAIEHVRLIDGTGAPARKNVTVLVAGQQIQSIRNGAPAIRGLPAGTRVVDAQGETMIPGLINAHGHLALVSGTKNSATAYTAPNVMAELRQYEHYGVLDVLSLGLNRDLLYAIRSQQQAGELDGAGVFTADRGIGAAGGAPQVPHDADQLYQPKTPEEARRAVDEAASRHTSFIKIWVDDMHGKVPKMPPEIESAVIDEAHKNHLPVAAHVYALADAKALVAAGVDVLAHSVRDAPVDRELIALMKKHGTYYIPTLTVDESFFVFADHPELLDDPFVTHATSPEEIAKLRSAEYRQNVASDPTTAQHRADLLMAERNLRTLYDASVRIAFGTDSGANPVRLPGFAEHRELQLMVQAGLTPLEALRCATATDAALLGIAAQTGTLAPGRRADFLLLAADPSTKIANTQQIISIWHNGFAGQPWVAAQVAAQPTQPAKPSAR